MSCCHHYDLVPEGDYAFSIVTTPIIFGRGCFQEIGERARELGMSKIALFTDRRVGAQEFFRDILVNLRSAGLTVVVFDEVSVEPTDASVKKAIEFATDEAFDGFISVGGGSVIDTCKAANVYSTYPAPLLTYVNGPIGEGQAIPGDLKPHISCPTTSGTGSESTGIIVFDLLEEKAKTGISDIKIKPNLALVDPVVMDTLPSQVLAYSGFDVLSHALESFTAKPFTQRKAPTSGMKRPLSQGANPWSDIGCREALRLVGANLDQAVNNSEDTDAREQMLWASTLAGVGFGNAGCHLPHAMSYSVSGMVDQFRPSEYPPEHALIPHGMAVILNAPAVFEFTSTFSPERHLEGAALLGADMTGATLDDAGEVLSKQILDLMKKTGIPNGLCGVGYSQDDVNHLVEGALPQQRLIGNAPKAVDGLQLKSLYEKALRYW